MFYQALGIIMGIISGFVWEKLSTTPPTLLPSMVLKVNNRGLHFHHWMGYLVILIIILTLAFKADKLSYPATLMLFFFFIGALTYNFYKFPDWHIFIK
jgi:hypothetical protein